MNEGLPRLRMLLRCSNRPADDSPIRHLSAIWQDENGYSFARERRAGGKWVAYPAGDADNGAWFDTLRQARVWAALDHLNSGISPNMVG